MQATPMLSALILALSAHAAQYEPSRFLFGRVDLNTPALPPWYLKSLTAAGVSDLILPGYLPKEQALSGPIELWASLSRSDREEVLHLASAKSNRILMQAEVGDGVLVDSQVTSACQKAADLGLDGLVFSSFITEAQYKACSKIAGAVFVASAQSIPSISTVKVFQLQSNADVLANTAKSDDILALCDLGTCPKPTKIADNGLVYLNVIPGMTDLYLEEFLKTDLPKLNGLFDSNDRPERQ